MTTNLIRIFTDELVRLRKVDGSGNIGIIQSSKNNFAEIENLSLELQNLHEVVFTVKVHGNNRLDFSIKIKDIHSIERT